MNASVIKPGDKVDIKLSDFIHGSELYNWLTKNSGHYEVRDVDYTSNHFWLEHCGYTFNMDSILKVSSKPKCPPSKIKKIPKESSIDLEAKQYTCVDRNHPLESMMSISGKNETQVVQSLLYAIERLQDAVNIANTSTNMNGYFDEDYQEDMTQIYQALGLDVRFESSNYAYELVEYPENNLVLLIPEGSPRGATLCFGKNGLELPMGYWSMNCSQKKRVLDMMYGERIQHSIDNMYDEEDM